FIWLALMITKVNMARKENLCFIISLNCCMNTLFHFEVPERSMFAKDKDGPHRHSRMPLSGIQYVKVLLCAGFPIKWGMTNREVHEEQAKWRKLAIIIVSVNGKISPFQNLLRHTLPVEMTHS